MPENSQEAILKSEHIARRTQAYGPGDALVPTALTAVMLAGAGAGADPIIFENPAGLDHFQWPSYSYLDITLDASVQDTTYGTQAFFFQDNRGRSAGRYSPLTTLGGYNESAQDADGYLMGFEAGAMIDGSLGFAPNADTYDQFERKGIIGSGTVYYDGVGFVYSSFDSELPADQRAYLGVRFELGGATHYGWIGVIRNPGGADVTSDSFELDPFAWGYESTPETAIRAGVPAPSALAMLALGAAGVLRRTGRGR